MLVAADGEWTRRRIDGPEVARRLSRDLAIPVYDAQVTGYPQRMRDWSPARRATASTDPRPGVTSVDGRCAARCRDRSAGSSAMRASIVASRVRTGTPVPPLGV